MSEHPMKVTPVIFDRTINLPFLVTVLASVMAAAAWSSTMSDRMARVEQAVSGLPVMQERIARMDERSEATKATMARLERALER